MNTKLKVIVTAASLAALASPVMATESNRSAEAAQAHASAHVRHHHAYGRARITDTPMVTPGNRPLIDDCIHVTFPQCGGDGEQVLR